MREGGLFFKLALIIYPGPRVKMQIVKQISKICLENLPVQSKFQFALMNWCRTPNRFGDPKIASTTGTALTVGWDQL